VTTPQTVTRCARAAHCYAPERNGDELLGAPCDRPLCDTCERKVRHALEDAPLLYVLLRGATLIRGAAIRTEMVTASKGSPMPLNTQALDLGEQLWWLLVTWEDEVRRIARLTVRVRHGMREGRQVADAATVLGSHLTAWVAAPPTRFLLHSGHDTATPAVTEQSGVEAACALLDWRGRVRNMPGMDVRASKALRRYEHPCPACGIRAVTHRAGDDLMQCQNCWATAPYLPTLPREADYRMPEEGAA
jgi:hypothetical protein